MFTCLLGEACEENKQICFDQMQTRMEVLKLESLLQPILCRVSTVLCTLYMRRFTMVLFPGRGRATRKVVSAVYGVQGQSFRRKSEIVKYGTLRPTVTR